MNKEMLDLYSDYLLCSSKQTTATGLAALTDGAVSHDQITRFLAGGELDEKELWLQTKKLIREYEQEDGCLIFDDTIVEKPYTDESDIICWYYDHSRGRTVKGINILTAFYTAERSGERLSIPVGYRIVEKTETTIDPKTQKERRISPETKNEMARAMIETQIRNQVKFGYILADSWFASGENMRFINKKRKVFIFAMKENRLVARSEEERAGGRFGRLDTLAIPEKTPVKVWLKDLEFPVVLYQEVFRNKDGSTERRFLVSNDVSLSSDRFETLYKKRWSVEVYHKSLKQNASIGSSPAHTVRTQSNHIFAALYSFVKLERVRLSKGLNHFAIKTKLYMSALQSLFSVRNTMLNDA